MQYITQPAHHLHPWLAELSSQSRNEAHLVSLHVKIRGSRIMITLKWHLCGSLLSLGRLTFERFPWGDVWGDGGVKLKGKRRDGGLKG